MVRQAVNPSTQEAGGHLSSLSHCEGTQAPRLWKVRLAGHLLASISPSEYFFPVLETESHEAAMPLLQLLTSAYTN